jgi:hypothetical protein
MHECFQGVQHATEAETVDPPARLERGGNNTSTALGEEE